MLLSLYTVAPIVCFLGESTFLFLWERVTKVNIHWYLLAHVLRVCKLYIYFLGPYSINWICWVMLCSFFIDLAGGIYGNYKLWRIFDFSSCSGLKNRDSWRMIWTDIGKPHDQNIPSLNVTSRTYSSFEYSRVPNKFFG